MSYVDKIAIAGTSDDRRIKLLPEQKTEIRKLIEHGFGDVEIAKEYEVSRTTIYFLRNKTAYANCLKNNKANHIPLSKTERRKYMQQLRARKEGLSL